VNPALAGRRRERVNLNTMNPLRRAIGVVLFAVGFVWFLLGVGLVGGSVMSNQPWAAVLGGAAAVIGLWMLTRKPKDADEG
jgi:hypothetical protein